MILDVKISMVMHRNSLFAVPTGDYPDQFHSCECKLSQAVINESRLRSEKSFGLSFPNAYRKPVSMNVKSWLFSVRANIFRFSSLRLAQAFRLTGFFVLVMHSSFLFANASEPNDGTVIDSKAELKNQNLNSGNSNSVEPVSSIAAETLSSGIELYNRGDYRESKRILENVARKSPYDASTRYYLGLVYQALKQNVMARAQFAWVASSARDANLRRSAARALGTFINPKRAGEAELLRPGADNDYRTLLAAARAEVAAQRNSEKNSEPGTNVDAAVGKSMRVEDQSASPDSGDGASLPSKDGNGLDSGLAEGKKLGLGRSKEALSQRKVVSSASSLGNAPSSKSVDSSRKVYFRVLYFYSPDSTTCEAFEPIYCSLSAKFPSLDYRKVLFQDKASAEERALAERYKVSHVPRLVYTDAHGEELFNEDISLFRERLKDLSGTAKYGTK